MTKEKSLTPECWVNGCMGGQSGQFSFVFKGSSGILRACSKAGFA